jgi:RNA 3'-terminal phosphate cyclase (GTP)
MIEIDGSYGEGGGQVTRMAVSLACITKKPVRVYNIRAGRNNPGLRAQHVTAINAMDRLCGGKVIGNKIGSTEITFTPGKIRHGVFKFNVGTAGAVTLVLQPLVPIAAFANDHVTFEIIGGTDVKWSPTLDYFEHVFCSYMKQLGLEINLQIDQRGFYPKGAGKTRVVITPWKEKKPFNHIKQGQLKRIDVFSIASEELRKAKVAERQIMGFEGALHKKLHNFFEDKEIHYVKTLSTGSTIHAHAHLKHGKLGIATIGERGVIAEKIGQSGGEKLLAEIESGATVDHRMADQILPYLAFTGGKFKTSRISNHFKTNAWVIQQFLPNVKITINEKTRIVEVKN